MPVLFIGIPLLAVIILNLPFKEAGKKSAFWVAIFVTLAQIAISLTAGSTIWLKTDSVINTQFIANLSIDFFSAVVLFTIGLIAFVCLIVNKYSASGDSFNFINLILLIIAGMNGVVMVTDLFSLYVFLEVTSIASFILIALYKQKEGLEGAFKYLILSAMATIMMLSAIALIFMMTGETRFTAVGQYIEGLKGAYPFQIVLAFILFTAGLSIKAGLVPFHAWVPDAYSSPSSAVSVLLAGIVTKVSGVYIIMRLFKDVFSDVSAIGNILVVLGLISIIIGALAAIGQNDFKRMLAYSSISQIGYIILGVGTGLPLGFAGALLHFFNHSTFKSLLFVNSAAVEMQTGKRDIDKLGGLASKMPVTAGSSIIAFLSTAGIPPLSGFWSKLVIIIAVWSVSPVAAGIALLASIITLAYFLILQKKVFFGKPAEGMEDVKESNVGIVGIEILLSGITIAMGILFPLVLIFMQSKGLI